MIGLFGTETQTPRGGRVRAAQVIEAVLLLAGTICAGWFGYNWIASEADQLWSNYSLDERLTGHTPSVKGFITHTMNGGAEQNTASPSESAATSSSAEPETEELPDWPARI